MEVRSSGKEIDAKDSQLEKAKSAMLVRLSGSAIDIKEEHRRKALSPMEVTPSGTTTWPFPSGVYRQSQEALP